MEENSVGSGSGGNAMDIFGQSIDVRRPSKSRRRVVSHKVPSQTHFFPAFLKPKITSYYHVLEALNCLYAYLRAPLKCKIEKNTVIGKM